MHNFFFKSTLTDEQKASLKKVKEGCIEETKVDAGKST